MVQDGTIWEAFALERPYRKDGLGIVHINTTNDFPMAAVVMVIDLLLHCPNELRKIWLAHGVLVGIRVVVLDSVEDVNRGMNIFYGTIKCAKAMRCRVDTGKGSGRRGRADAEGVEKGCEDAQFGRPGRPAQADSVGIHERGHPERRVF